VDFTNPDARTFWQDGVAKLLKMGVAGFKLDRSEENIPESGPYKVFDERTIRENRNAYPAMYVQAAYEVAKKHRGDDFVVMPRAGYSGSSRYAVFWRRHRRDAGRTPRFDHCGAARRRDGIPELGLRHLRIQPTADGAGGLRALAGIFRIHSNHGSRTYP